MKKLLSKLFFLLVITVILVAFSHVAGAFEIGARGYYWFPTLKKSDIRDDTDTKPGTEFSLKDDLGLGSENYPSVEVFAGLGKNHFSLMYTQADYSGSTRLARDITFEGTTFWRGPRSIPVSRSKCSTQLTGATSSTWKTSWLDFPSESLAK